MKYSFVVVVVSLLVGTAISRSPRVTSNERAVEDTEDSGRREDYRRPSSPRYDDLSRSLSRREDDSRSVRRNDDNRRSPNRPEDTRRSPSRYDEDRRSPNRPEDTRRSTSRFDEDRRSPNQPEDTRRSTSRFDEDRQSPNRPEDTRRSPSRYDENHQSPNRPENNRRSPSRYGKDQREASDVECDHRLSSEDEIHESFKPLFLIAEKDLAISEANQDDQHQCQNAEKHFRQFQEHMKCVDEKHKQKLKVIGDGFKKSIHNRCKSLSWHNQYLKYSKCFESQDMQEDMHTCSDKTYAALRYALTNMADKDRYRSSCCIGPFFTECIQNVTRKACGQRGANFVVNTYWEPLEGAVKYLCKGKFEEWCDNDPIALEDFEDIFAQNAKHQKEGFYRLYLKTIENHFDVDQY